ncbi:choice-of-anchor P family protein [Nocardioides sp. YIM 152588]|uniref:choice-of-anchor P family protein n=1 Tax=Nocardioides sp. YIM 152588 TaxID=3158259 RepID=UPI0032E4E2E8
MKTTRLAAVASSVALLVASGVSVALLGAGGTANAATASSSATGVSLKVAGHVLHEGPTVTWTSGGTVTDSAVSIPAGHHVSGSLLNVSASSGAASANLAELSVELDLFAGIEHLTQIFTELHPVCGAIEEVELTEIEHKFVDKHGLIVPDLMEKVVNKKLKLMSSLHGYSGHGRTSAKTFGLLLHLHKVKSIKLSKLSVHHLEGLCEVEGGHSTIFGFTKLAVDCIDGVGSTSVIGLTVAGKTHELEAHEANHGIEIPGLMTVQLNRQTHNADGSLTVDGLYVNFHDKVELTVATATCGTPPSTPPSTPPAPTPPPTTPPTTPPAPTPPPTTPPTDVPPAPTPTSPVTTNVPVTG